MATGTAPRPSRLGAYRSRQNGAARCTDARSLMGRLKPMSLADIAAGVEVSKPVVARLARENGLQVATPGPKVKHVFERLTSSSIRRQEVPGCRDCGRDGSLQSATVARWAKTFGIPVRSQGGASHTAVRKARGMSSQAPCCAGQRLTSPGGRKRLQHFAAAVKFPTR